MHHEMSAFAPSGWKCSAGTAASISGDTSITADIFYGLPGWQGGAHFSSEIEGCFPHRINCRRTVPASTTTAQTDDQLKTWCFGDAADDQKILGCESIIKAGKETTANVAKAFVNRGLGYANKGQYDRAIQDYDQAIKLDPNYANAFNNRGIAYADKDQYDRAIQDFDQAIKLNPHFAEVFDNRGNRLHRQRSIRPRHPGLRPGDQARSELRQSLRRSRQCLRPAKASATALFKTLTRRSCSIRTSPTPSTFAATPTTTKASTTVPSRTSTRRSSSIRITPMPSTIAERRYPGKGQCDRAIQDFDQAIKLNPHLRPSLQQSRYLLLRQTGQYDRAIQDYDQAIKLNPNDAIAFNNRGNAYAHKGQYDRAIQDYDQAIKLDPNDAFAIKNRAIAIAKKRK